MAITRVELEIPDGLMPYLDEIGDDIRGQLVEDLVLAIMHAGKIDVVQAAEFLQCDPDDILTTKDESEVRKALADDDYEDWEDVKRELELS